MFILIYSVISLVIRKCSFHEYLLHFVVFLHVQFYVELILHPLHLICMQAIKPTNLGCESADKWLLPSTSTIAICYYCSARKLILILLSHGGWRLSRPRHCRKGAQPVPKAVHRSGCRDKHNWPRPLTPVSYTHLTLPTILRV